MDGGALQATVHGVTKSWTRLSNFTFFLSLRRLKFFSRQEACRGCGEGICAGKGPVGSASYKIIIFSECWSYQSSQDIGAGGGGDSSGGEECLMFPFDFRIQVVCSSSIHASTYPSIHPPTHPFIHPSTYPFTEALHCVPDRTSSFGSATWG